MILSLIVAMSENNVIGANQKLPWHLPEDLKRFKKLTLGHPIIMGRKTYDSIGRILPGRTNIIVTRSVNRSVEGAVMAASVNDALKPYKSSDQEIFIIGGGEIFSQTLSVCDRIYLTLIHQQIDGDVKFPELNYSGFNEVFREWHETPIPHSFVNLNRKIK
jgi:dihydrofolate reductase